MRPLAGLVLAIALAALGACAPMIQTAGLPGADFTGPRLEDHDVVSFDGQKLGLMRWIPEGPEPWAVIVGVHGMNDYSNAFHLAGPYWASQGIATFAYDQRGFGRSPQIGVWGGEKLMTEDLRTVTALGEDSDRVQLAVPQDESLDNQPMPGTPSPQADT